MPENDWTIIIPEANILNSSVKLIQK